MNTSAVQNERGPRRHKIVAALKHKIKKAKVEKFSLKCSTNVNIFLPLSHASTSDVHSHHEMLIQILLTCLNQAQSSECLSKVSEYQRNVILQNVWSELFVLKASHWPIDIVAAIESCGDKHVLEVINNTKTLKADLMELSLLEIMILSRPEYAVNVKERLTLQFNLESSILQLEYYILQQSSVIDSRGQSVMRFSKLLLGLRQLRLRESFLNSLLRECSEKYLKCDKK